MGGKNKFNQLKTLPIHRFGLEMSSKTNWLNPDRSEIGSSWLQLVQPPPQPWSALSRSKEAKEKASTDSYRGA